MSYLASVLQFSSLWAEERKNDSTIRGNHHERSTIASATEFSHIDLNELVILRRLIFAN
jgi:hypothetical protein